MQITATEAKNRFGYCCVKAKGEPVFVEKDGQFDSVILSFESYQRMNPEPVPERVIESFEERKRKFQEQYKEWFEWQNRLVEEHGLWCDGVVVRRGTDFEAVISGV